MESHVVYIPHRPVDYGPDDTVAYREQYADPTTVNVM